MGIHHKSRMQETTTQTSTFDEVLGLEEQFYEDGFRQGYEDGVKAGRVEGRTFGLEKGFEKYVESGRTHVQDSAESSAVQPSQPFSLHAMPENQRLAKHLKVLHALAESESLSTENTEEAVSDFDDRLKRAQGKAKIIERIVGENQGDATAVAGTKNGAST